MIQHRVRTSDIGQRSDLDPEATGAALQRRDDQGPAAGHLGTLDSGVLILVEGIQRTINLPGRGDVCVDIFRQAHRRGGCRRLFRHCGGCRRQDPAVALAHAGRRRQFGDLHARAGAAVSPSDGAPGTASAAAWLSFGSTRSRTRATPYGGMSSRVAVRRGDLHQAVGIAGAAVVQPHGDFAAVFQVGQTGDGGKLDGRVGGGERGLVEHLAIGGQPSGGVLGDGGDAGFIQVEGFPRVDPYALAW